MPSMVKCKYCKIPFDREQYKFCKPSETRHAHPECALKYTQEHNLPPFEIFDPKLTTSCIFCKKTLHKNKDDVIQVYNGKNIWAHKSCFDYDQNRDKTDADRLNDYIRNLFRVERVHQTVLKEIEKYIEDGYTYTGIHKTLIYFYEVKKGDISKANGHLGIVPYVYDIAKKYYQNLWKIEQQNKNTVIEEKPKEEIVVKSNYGFEHKEKKKSKFSFLDEEE